jgi:hypothetical protein
MYLQASGEPAALYSLAVACHELAIRDKELARIGLLKYSLISILLGGIRSRCLSRIAQPYCKVRVVIPYPLGAYNFVAFRWSVSKSSALSRDRAIYQ